MNETLVLISIFFAVPLVAFAISNYFLRRGEIARNISSTRAKRTQTDEEIDRILGNENEEIRYYLDVVKSHPPNSLPMRLVQAGFFSKKAVGRLHLIRVTVAAVIFVMAQILGDIFFENVGGTVILFFGAILAALSFILCSMVLENIGLRRTREFRKLFPDFMDLLLVCVDSGLGIEAALQRVTREFLLTTRDFGVQLSIMNLEVRAGRSLHEALQNFALRVNLEEARTLAVLFKQSQELGTSVGKTLRVYARELRQMRLVRAEEKANALPVKMLFPMAAFMFPVNLIIVLIPVLLVIVEMLQTLTPS